MIRSGRGGRFLAVVAGALLLSSPSPAHDYWIERSAGGLSLVYGHGAQRLQYDPSAVIRISAFDAEGKPIKHTTEARKSELLIRAASEPAMVAAELDSGYWSKTIYGLKNLPKRKASRVVEAYRSLYYTKTLAAWGPVTQRPAEGLRLEIMPLGSPFELKAGDTLPLRVLCDGKPIAGAEIERDHEAVGATDRDGTARVRLTRDRQLLTVEWRERIAGDPDADYLSLTATLTFEVNK